MAQVSRTRTLTADPAAVWALLPRGESWTDSGTTVTLTTTAGPFGPILERIVARLVARGSASLVDSLAQATGRVPS